MDDQTNVPSNIVINGQEYSTEDIQSALEVKNKAGELESKWNTKLDSLMPEYTRLTQERSQWQSEKQQLQQQIAHFQQKQDRGTDTEADFEKAKEAARKLGIPLKEDLEKEGYVKKDDLEKYLEERDLKRSQVESILKKADELEQQIDGSDGRPKFNKKMVLAWAQAYGKTDLMEAYKDMHGDVLKEWEATQVESKKNPSLKTIKPSSGKKEPSDVRPNDDNVKDMLREQLWGAR